MRAAATPHGRPLGPHDYSNCRIVFGKPATARTVAVTVGQILSIWPMQGGCRVITRDRAPIPTNRQTSCLIAARRLQTA